MKLVHLDCVIQIMLVVMLFTGCSGVQEVENQSADLETIIQREYVVSDIIRSYDSPKSLFERVDEWIVCVTANVEPGKWNDGRFTIVGVYESECLRARCTLSTHKRIQAMLEDIRQFIASGGKSLN